MPKNPWFKFYPSDWRSDPLLRMCSMGARGLWIEMLCIMDEATPRGHLLVNNHSPTDAQLSVLAGAPPDQLSELLRELETAGVFSRTRQRVIFSRKMVRDTKRAAISRKNGREGGNPKLLKETENSPQDNPRDKAGVFPRSQKLEARVVTVGSNEPTATTEKPSSSWSTDELFDHVLSAVGHTRGSLPTHWSPPAAMIHVARWRDDLHIPDELIVTAARDCRARFSEPPNGPKALDHVMRGLAAELNAPKMEIPDASNPTPPSAGQRYRGGAHDPIIAGFLSAANREP